MFVQTMRSSRTERVSYTVTIVVASVLVLAACVMQTTISTPQVLQDTPEDAVRSYYDALNRADIQAVQQLIDPENESDVRFLAALQDKADQGLPWKYRNVRVQLVEETDQTARLRTGVDLSIELQDGTTSTVVGTDLFSAVNKGGKWYLVGLSDEFPPGWLLDSEP